MDMETRISRAGYGTSASVDLVSMAIFFFFLLWACFKNINMCLLKRQSSTLLCKPNPELLYYIRRRRKIRGELGQRVLFSKIGVMASV